ncbi:MAG TPA: FHA domain-containing protein [Candidatus Dormibacteraeota bacterium]|nr:FHA domain-containing protein [Candidatus Dormibacteraeota bacterium]
MKVTCSNCGANHSLPDAQLAGHARVQFRCAKCGKNTIVEVARNPDATHVLSPMPQFARSAGAPRLAGVGNEEAGGLHLPEGKTIALSVIAGPARGLVYTLEKPRVVLGRADSDVLIADPEISRWHCSIEIKDDVIRLRDLESTNGTYFADERVRAAELKHLSEFRIGASVILVSVTPKLALPW